MSLFDYAQSEPQAKYRYAPFVVILTSTGLPTAGQTFVAADIKVRKAGGSLANCANFASVIDCGGGQYIYPLSLTELNTQGDLQVQYVKTGSISDLRTYLVGPQVPRDLATAGSSTTVTLPSTFVSATDYYRGQVISITAGTGAGQRRAAASQALLVVGVDRAWVTNPDATSEITIAEYDQVAASGFPGLALTSDVTSAVTSIEAAIPTVSNILDALLTSHAVEGSVGDGIAIAAGMLQGNFFMDEVNNTDANGQTSCRIRLFRTKTAVAAATSGGSGEGEFKTFVVSTSYSGVNKIVTHRSVEQ